MTFFVVLAPPGKVPLRLPTLVRRGKLTKPTPAKSWSWSLQPSITCLQYEYIVLLAPCYFSNKKKEKWCLSLHSFLFRKSIFYLG